MINPLAIVVDKFVESMSPQMGYKRRLARQALELSTRQQRQKLDKFNDVPASRPGYKETDFGYQRNRDIARSVYEENLVAQCLVDKLESAIVGRGIGLEFMDTENEDYAKRAQRIVSDWWKNDADMKGVFSGYEMEKLLYSSLKVDGDVMIHLLSDGKIQIIESDQVKGYNTTRGNDGEQWFHGVKVDKYQRPLLYRVYNNENYVDISARNIVHFANRKRYSQIRGKSGLESSSSFLRDITEYIETSIIHSKISLSHVLFIQKSEEAHAEDDTESPDSSTESDGVRDDKIVPGSILRGEAGEDAKIIGTTTNMVGFQSFITELQRICSSSLGLPIEMGTLNFSGVTYSSARAALAVAYEGFCQEKLLFVQVFSKIWRWRLQKFIADGDIEPPAGGVLPNVVAPPPIFIALDPAREIEGHSKRIDKGLDTNTSVLENYYQKDFNNVLSGRVSEIKAAQALADDLNKEFETTSFNWRDLIDSRQSDQVQNYIEDRAEQRREGNTDTTDAQDE